MVRSSTCQWMIKIRRKRSRGSTGGLCVAHADESTSRQGKRRGSFPMRDVSRGGQGKLDLSATF